MSASGIQTNDEHFFKIGFAWKNNLLFPLSRTITYFVVRGDAMEKENLLKTKHGGREECFFENGTSFATFKKQIERFFIIEICRYSGRKCNERLCICLKSKKSYKESNGYETVHKLVR